MDNLKICCPYCSFNSEVLNTLEIATVSMPICMPYTRDIGRFDNGEWSVIGKDYFSFLRWEKFGILRTFQNSKVFYKVETCTNCNSKYDIFLNQSAENNLTEKWDHLFSLGIDNKINRVQSNTVLNNIIDYLNGKSNYSKIATFFSCLAISFLLALPMLLSSNYQNGFDLVFDVFLVFSFSILAYFSYRQVQYILTTSDFYDYFKLDKSHVNFWLNYTLSRFIGVSQFITIKKKWKVSLINQVSLVGYFSSCSALIIWILVRHDFSIYGISKLFFCLALSYYIGISTWKSLNPSTYLINIACEVPYWKENLGKLNGFIPLKKIAYKSTALLMSIFIIYIISISITIVNPNNLSNMWFIEWLNIWIFLVLLGLGIVNSFYSKALVLYSLLFFALTIIAYNYSYTFSLSGISFHLYGPLLTSSLFLSIVIYSHLDGVFSPISSLKYKDYLSVEKYYNDMLNELQSRLKASISNINSDNDELKSLSDTITTVTRMKLEALEINKEKQSIIHTLLVGSPIAASIIIPLIINLFSSQVYDLFIK